MERNCTARLSALATSAVANRSLKGEDAYATVVDDATNKGCFGVFDSHGGKQAGMLAATELTQHLVALDAVPMPGSSAADDAFPGSAVSDRFWSMDKRLGADGIMSGTTASVLLVSAASSSSSVEEAPTLHCKLAWVGDSTSCLVDMRSDEAQPLLQTKDHKPSNEDEVTRMDLEWQVRAELQAMAAQQRRAASASAAEMAPGDNPNDSFILLSGELSNGSNGMSNDSFYAKRKAPTAEEVRAALEALELREIGELAFETLVRALGREKRIEAPEKRRSFQSPDRPGLARANSGIIKRGFAQHSAHGPMVLAGGSVHSDKTTDTASSHGSNHGSVNTCVTRSIGDWDGARAMIPQPDMHAFKVVPGEHKRAIICSDGVW